MKASYDERRLGRNEGKVGSQDRRLDSKGGASVFGGKSRVAEHQEVPKEEAAVKAIGALEDRLEG
jgi:hypothetical protein